jgi:voltage-dependent calcium channel L type alpha-1D
MITIILISSVFLAVEKPLDDPNSFKIKALKVIDDIFSCIFIIEAALKIITHGLVFNGK